MSFLYQSRGLPSNLGLYQKLGPSTPGSGVARKIYSYLLLLLLLLFYFFTLECKDPAIIIIMKDEIYVTICPKWLHEHVTWSLCNEARTTGATTGSLKSQCSAITTFSTNSALYCLISVKFSTLIQSGSPEAREWYWSKSTSDQMQDGVRHRTGNGYIGITQRRIADCGEI